jgi:hypothetical protein
MRRSITAARDSSKARELLGWMPSYPELDQQIAHDWTWFRDEMPKCVARSAPFYLGSFAGSVGSPRRIAPLRKFEIELLLADGPHVIGAANDAESALGVMDEAMRQYPTGHIRIRPGTAVFAERMPPRTPR